MIFAILASNSTGTNDDMAFFFFPRFVFHFTRFAIEFTGFLWLVVLLFTPNVTDWGSLACSVSVFWVSLSVSAWSHATGQWPELPTGETFSSLLLPQLIITCGFSNSLHASTNACIHAGKRAHRQIYSVHMQTHIYVCAQMRAHIRAPRGYCIK